MKRRLNPEYVAGILRETQRAVKEELSPEILKEYCDNVVRMFENSVAEKPYRGRGITVELDVPGVTPKQSLRWDADTLSDFYDELTEEEIQNARKARLLRMSIRARFEDLKKEAECGAPFSNLTIKRAKRIQRISQLIIDELLELDQLGKLRFIDGLSSMPKGSLFGINDPIF
nr:MAG TPA: hypothetical protein [Caudoviricetes sp.]